MATKEEIQERISHLLREKAPKPHECTICGHREWMIGDVYVHLSTSVDPNAATLGGSGFPLLPIICRHCGNTHLVNLLLLGFKESELKDLIYPKTDGESK